MNTHRFTGIFQTIDRLRAQGGIGLMLAGPGTGKSRLLERYAAARPTQDLAGAIFHLRAEVVNTPLGLVQSLLLQLDIGWHGTTRAGLAVLDSRLHGRPLLLLDDAHRLSQSVLELLRSLYEVKGFRLLLCGPPRLRSLLIRKCPELAHRVTVWARIDNLTLTDMREWLAEPLHPFAPALQEASGGNPFWANTLLEEARRLARRRHQALGRVLDTTLQPPVERTA